MKPTSAWLLMREKPPLRNEALAVIRPSKRVTNKATDDIVRDLHLKKYGRLWPNAASWTWGRLDESGRDELRLKTPLCTYVLVPIDLYG